MSARGATTCNTIAAAVTEGETVVAHGVYERNDQDDALDAEEDTLSRGTDFVAPRLAVLPGGGRWSAHRCQLRDSTAPLSCSPLRPLRPLWFKALTKCIKDARQVHLPQRTQRAQRKASARVTSRACIPERGCARARASAPGRPSASQSAASRVSIRHGGVVGRGPTTRP